MFEEWARSGGGRFFDAAGADTLGEAIAALQPPFAARDSAGAVIGSGVVDGDAAGLPSVTYTAAVRWGPPRAFPDVEVRNGDELEMSLADSG